MRNGQDKQASPTYQPDKNSLYNISPIDGRYQTLLAPFSSYFSEYALIRYRVQVEIMYLIFLSTCKVAPKLSKQQVQKLQFIFTGFSLTDAMQIKEIERTTNHDIKAVEYFVQQKCSQLKLDDWIPFIHWGITSDDTNNLAYGMALSQCNAEQMVPLLRSLTHTLKQITAQHAISIMIARTHGQPAVPTTFGKELSNFYFRLEEQVATLSRHQFTGKLMGAVGNLSAHKLAFPRVHWVHKSKEFVLSLGLKPHIHTTQILPLDNWVIYFQTLQNITTIVKGLSADLWTYIMLEEVKLKPKEGETGSSTMPQKVNPIDFENAEGNGEIANSYFQLYERKMLLSRLQRDLSDSVVKRTFGTALAHTFLAWRSLLNGLATIEFDHEAAEAHVMDHYEVLAEAIQTQLRLAHDRHGYETVKKLTRGKKMTQELYKNLVHELHLDHLKDLNPAEYCGYAEDLVDDHSL